MKAMIQSGIELYLLNDPKIRADKIDLNLMLKRGYLKCMPYCRRGGNYVFREHNGKIEPLCTIHDSNILKNMEDNR
jgi:hypothetical protein